MCSSHSSANLMFDNIILLNFQMNKTQNKACYVVCLFVCFSSIATVISTVDDTIAKMFRHILGSRILHSLSVVFCSVEAKASHAERGRGALSRPRPCVPTVHMALGMLWPQIEFGQLI